MVVADNAAIQEHLNRLIATPAFARAPKLKEFLRFIVEETLAGRSSQLKEYTIATEVYGRHPEFDPRLDATVRVEAHKLRTRLEAYYCGAGSGERVRILLGKGSYVPDISFTKDARPSEALDSCARGHELLGQRTPQALEEAYQCYWSAIVGSPETSEAYQGLAAYYFTAAGMEMLPPCEAWPRTRMAIAQARSLGRVAPAVELIEASLAYMRAEVTRSEAITQRTLKRNLKDPAAHFWHAGILSAQGRHIESVEHMRTAAAIAGKAGPDASLTILFEAHVSWALYHAHRYKAASDHLQDRFGAESSIPVVLYHRGRILTELGDLEAAIDCLLRVCSAVPIPMARSALAYAMARAGLRSEAEAILDEMCSTTAGYVSPVRTAVIHRALGRQQAYAADLMRAGHEFAMIWSNVDPQLRCVEGADS